MEELKRCPFCGGEAKLKKFSSEGERYGETFHIHDSFIVICDGCSIATPEMGSIIYINECGEVCIEKNGAENAVKKWNARVGD